MAGIARALTVVTLSVAAVGIGVGPAATATAAALLPPPAHPGAYTALQPQRILDTATGLGAPKGPVAAGATVTVDVSGHGGVPASGAGAVVLTLTVAAPTASGYLTAFPAGAARPGTSNLNFTRGRTVADLVVVPLGAGGAVSVTNSSTGTARIVADVSGWYAAGAPTDAGGFQSLAPARVLDTRAGLGAPAPTVGAHQTVSVQVAGQGGVPMTGASTVVLTVTAATPAAAGYVTVYPSGSARPATSTLNFPAGRTVANLVFAQLGPDGKVDLYNGSTGAVRLVADVAGYLLSGTPVPAGGYQPVAPARIMDTRTQTLPGMVRGSVPALGGVRLDLTGGPAGLPLYGGAAVVFNLTVTQARDQGYVTVYPTTHMAPYASNLNFTAGQTVANLVVVEPGDDGTVTFLNRSHGTVQLVADLVGYVVATPAIHFRTADRFPGSTGGQPDLTCPTTTFCLAAFQGRVDRLTGTTWSSPQDLFPGDGVTAVSCASTTFCVAGSVRGSVRTYNGATWSPASGAGTVGELRSLSCVSATFCMAADGTAHIHRFNGTGWSSSPQLNQVGYGVVSCTSTTFCLAVDGVGAVRRFNGSSWGAPVSLSTHSGALSLSCVSSTFCLFVDGVGQARTFNGSTWSAPAASGLTEGNTASCVSAAYCLATDVTQARRLQSGVWSAAGDLGGDLVRALDCVTTTFCAAMTNDGYARVFNGAAWSPAVEVDPATGTLNDVSCASASFCAVVSETGAALTWNGTAWSDPHIVALDTSLVGVSCPTATFCMSVGSRKALSYNGTGWSTPVDVDPGSGLVGVSCASASVCVAVNASGQAFTYDGSSWSGPVSFDGGGHVPVAVSCGSANSCVVAEASGDVVRLSGSIWSAPERIDTAALTAVSCSSATSCVAVDADGQAVVRSGSTWAAPSQVNLAGGALLAVSCRTSTFCVATGDHTTEVYTFGGDGWTATNTLNTSLNRVSCGSTDFCVGLIGSFAYVGRLH